MVLLNTAVYQRLHWGMKDAESSGRVATELTFNEHNCCRVTCVGLGSVQFITISVVCIASHCKHLFGATSS